MYIGSNSPLRVARNAFAFTLTLSASILSAQVKSSPNANCVSTDIVNVSSTSSPGSIPVGGGCGGNPNPNPSPGNPPTTPNYALNWSELQNYPSISIAGSYNRQSPAATVFDNSVWIAYTAKQTYSNSDSDKYVYAGTNGVFNAIYPTTGNILSEENPALIAIPGTFSNLSAQSTEQTAVLAVNSEEGVNGPGGIVGLYYTNNNGSTWQNFATTRQVGAPNAYYAPSLAWDGTYLYLAYSNANDQTLVLCKTSSVNNPLTCNTFPGTKQIGLNPGIGYFPLNNTLYIAFQALSIDHTVSLFTSTDQGQSIQQSSALSGDTTSVGPSLVVHNNALYVGFRTDDGDDYFIDRWSTDGVNFSPHESISDPWHIGGTPALVDGNLLNPAENYIYLYFCSDDGQTILNSYYGH